jgi:hypothetical protein
MAIRQKSRIFSVIGGDLHYIKETRVLPTYSQGGSINWNFIKERKIIKKQDIREWSVKRWSNREGCSLLIELKNSDNHLFSDLAMRDLKDFLKFLEIEQQIPLFITRD